MSILDREQLRTATMDDLDLMREILFTLLDDTSTQMERLGAAVSKADGGECMRLAHYSKGACATIGANSAAAILQSIERSAQEGDFDACGNSLRSLAGEMEKLRVEMASI
jgi:HPt (histidine-containing phosphotransfer) domain-containing protein